MSRIWPRITLYESFNPIKNCIIWSYSLNLLYSFIPLQEQDGVPL